MAKKKKKPKNTPKATKLEIAQRIDLVTEWIIDNKRRPEIIRKGSTMWGIGERQIEVYMHRAMNSLKEHAEQDIQNHRANAVAQLDFIINQNLIDKKLDDARKAIETKAKLLGLNAPEKQDHTHLHEFQFKLNMPTRE